MKIIRRNGISYVRLTRRDVAVVGLVVGTVSSIAYPFVRADLADFLFRQARGTRFEKPVVAWALQDARNPVTRDFARGRFKAGDPVESVTAAHPPVRAVRHGRHTTLEYGGCFEGVTVYARDGKLVQASIWSCTFSHEYFNAWEPGEALVARVSYGRFLDAEREGQRLAALAVAGPAATIDPWTLPQPATEPGN